LSAFLITNASDEIRSYTIEVEFRRDDRPFAAARGKADDVRPRERRAVSLSPPLSNQQAGTFSIPIGIVFSAGRGGRHTEAAERLRLEKPTALADLGLEVTVTNDDPAAHSAVVQAVLGYDGRFVQLLTGTAADLAPGQSRVVTLLGKGPLPSYNQVLLAVERVLQ
jgi:hypothetical protein